MKVQTDEDRVSVEVPGRARKALAGSAAVLVMACSLCFYVRSSVIENKIVFLDAFPEALPPGYVTQVELVRKLVPRGAILFYLMNKPETWQFGLWKRTLYPDYIVLPVLGTEQFSSPQVTAFRKLHHVRYVILAGVALAGVSQTVALPPYPNSTPLTLAELEN